MRRWVLLAAALVLAPALAGCASKGQANGATQNDLSKGSNGVTTDPIVLETPKPKGTSERWHFHDYWKGNPVITLLTADVELNATADDNGAHVLSTLVSLPQTVIVPAETGFLLVNVTWGAPGNTSTLPAGGEVNLTYRPADSNDYFGAGNVTTGRAARINTTESMCDVPHRQESLWRFNLSAFAPPGAPAAAPPALPGVPSQPPSPGAPSKTVHVVIAATIGRPLFIDPPHLNWWQGSDILPIVAKGAGDVAFTMAAQGLANVTIPKDPTTTQPSTVQRPVRVPVDQGRIVPEGAASIVVMLNWTSSVPNAKLLLGFVEGNNPSQGTLTVAKDGASSRVFSMPVTPPQTDTTYSNRTTWEFQIKADPTGAQAFDGTFTLVAWTTKLVPAEAVKALAP